MCEATRYFRTDCAGYRVGRSLTGMRTLIAMTAWLWLGLGVSGWGVLHGCSGSLQDARTESALNVMAQVIDPAYAAATDACLAKQAAITDEVGRGAITVDQARGLIRATRDDCDRVETAFERIRALHEAAKIAYREGQRDQLEQALRKLTEAWTTLKGGGS
jgi:hypothetical protein